MRFFRSARRAVPAYAATKRLNLPLWPKIALFLALAYGVSPIDAIPDIIPILGLVDDLLIAGGLLMTAVSGILRHLQAQAVRQENPRRLGIDPNKIIR